MDNTTAENMFLSYISPDPIFQKAGIVRISNSDIRYIAKIEGFITDEMNIPHRTVTDEQRIVVRIMFNHSAALLVKKDGPNKEQLLVFYHKDGIISCENETSEIVLFHCFANIDDLIAYHICTFIPTEYDEPSYRFQFLVPIDKTFYTEPHTLSYSVKLKNAVIQKLYASTTQGGRLAEDEQKYIREWENPKFSIQLHANNENREVGFISFLFCESCIWCIYPFENNYARVKVIGSAEAQNKLCEFVRAFCQ